MVPGAGVDSLANNDVINIEPSPSHGKSVLSLDMPGGRSGRLSISVSNAAGQQVMTRSLSYAGGRLTQEIDLSTAAKGLYFVSVITPYGQRIVRRLLIE